MNIVWFERLNRYGLTNILSDKCYLKMAFKATFGRKLNLKEPKTFNEKLQWLKLYDRKAEYTTYVDKYKVREYIAEKLGEEYLIPLLGVWDNPDDIDFDALPDQFVLKCNHNSGTGMCICTDKSKLNITKVKKELKKGLKENYYFRGREWPYKNVERKITCEKFLKSGEGGLIDYKFYCFNGEPKFLYVSQGLDNHATANISFLTMDWQFADFKRNDYNVFNELPKKPKNFDKMVEIAKILSKDVPFLRVDLYEVNDKVYFSELTFFPGSGFTKLEPEEWDYKFGSWIDLQK